MTPLERKQRGEGEQLDSPASPTKVSNPESRGMRRPPAQDDSLSAATYALIALIGLLVGLAFTVFYVHWVPVLVQNGTEGKIFYVLLIPWGLACAAFLFGAMKGYAKVTSNHLGVAVELGGPVALFCLVLWGGFRLVPPAPEAFDMSVSAHSADNSLFTEGKIILDLPGHPTAEINQRGEALFRGLPRNLKNTQVKILPVLNGYEQKWIDATITGADLDITVEKAHPTLIVTGSIDPVPPDFQTLKIVVDGQDGEAIPGEQGEFHLKVNGSSGQRVLFKVFRGRTLIYHDFQILPGPVTLSLR